MKGQWRVWCGHRNAGIGWFRLLGVGLAWRDHRSWPPRFTERYSGQHGITRRTFVHFGPWCVHLTTWRHP